MHWKAERSSRDEAQRRLAQAQAALRDVGKGLRPTEVAALTAQLQQAKSVLQLAETEYHRQETLFRAAVVSAQSLDNARAAGSRANVSALEAVLARAEWELAQKSRRAPEAATVYDTLYRSGEWVAAAYAFFANRPRYSAQREWCCRDWGRSLADRAFCPGCCCY